MLSNLSPSKSQPSQTVLAGKFWRGKLSQSIWRKGNQQRVGILFYLIHLPRLSFTIEKNNYFKMFFLIIEWKGITENEKCKNFFRAQLLPRLCLHSAVLGLLIFNFCFYSFHLADKLFSNACFHPHPHTHTPSHSTSQNCASKLGFGFEFFTPSYVLI